eukprot:g18883.t1
MVQVSGLLFGILALILGLESEGLRLDTTSPVAAPEELPSEEIGHAPVILANPITNMPLGQPPQHAPAPAIDCCDAPAEFACSCELLGTPSPAPALEEVPEEVVYKQPVRSLDPITTMPPGRPNHYEQPFADLIPTVPSAVLFLSVGGSGTSFMSAC